MTVMLNDNEIVKGWKTVLGNREEHVDGNAIELNYTDIQANDEVFAEYLLFNPEKCFRLAHSVVGNGIPVRVVGLPEIQRKDIGELYSAKEGRFYSIIASVSKVSCNKIEEDGEGKICFQHAELHGIPLNVPATINAYVEEGLEDHLWRGSTKKFNGYLERIEDDEQMFHINSIENPGTEYPNVMITEEDEREIIKASEDPEFFDKLARSIAPSIYGLDDVKEVLALQLFGGCIHKTYDGFPLRSDIDVLIIGEPHTGVVTTLKSMSRLHPKGLFISKASESEKMGFGTKITDDYFEEGDETLTFGAMNLANEGLLCVENLDDFGEKDISDIYGATYDQYFTVRTPVLSIRYPARTSVLASVVPKYGRIDDSVKPVEQTNLPYPLLGRFDAILLVKDRPDIQRDTTIAEKILKSHMRSRSESDGGLYSEEFVRKYVAYAKRLQPKMTEELIDLIVNDYLSIEKSPEPDSTSIIKVRHLESIFRFSEASARSRLSYTVDETDVRKAIWVIKNYLHKLCVTSETGDS